MKRLTATTALCVLFCTAFAAGKGPAATVPGSYPDSLRSVWLYTEGIKQNTIFHDTVRAREYLTEAIRADSTYAPAYYEMATNGMYSTPDEAVELAEYCRDLGFNPEQVQDFYPTPGSMSTVMYATGVDPRTLQPIYVPKNPHEKALQRALIQYRDPRNRDLVREALRKAGRMDLIGYGPKCLVRPKKDAGVRTGKGAGSRHRK